MLCKDKSYTAANAAEEAGETDLQTKLRDVVGP